jgi:hypothetical protein
MEEISPTEIWKLKIWLYFVVAHTFKGQAWSFHGICVKSFGLRIKTIFFCAKSILCDCDYKNDCHTPTSLKLGGGWLGLQDLTHHHNHIYTSQHHNTFHIFFSYKALELRFKLLQLLYYAHHVG